MRYLVCVIVVLAASARAEAQAPKSVDGQEYNLTSTCSPVLLSGKRGSFYLECGRSRKGHAMYSLRGVITGGVKIHRYYRDRHFVYYREVPGDARWAIAIRPKDGPCGRHHCIFVMVETNPLDGDQWKPFETAYRNGP